MDEQKMSSWNGWPCVSATEQCSHEVASRVSSPCPWLQTAPPTQAAEQRAAADRATREVASLSAELAALKEDLGETLSSKSKVTLMSLSTMEKIQVRLHGALACGSREGRTHVVTCTHCGPFPHDTHICAA